MRLALCLLIFFVVAYASKTPKRSNYFPYYEPNIAEHQRFLKSSTTVTTTKILTAIYTINCTKSTTACTSSSTSSTTSSSATSTATTTSSSTSTMSSSTSSNTATTSSTTASTAGRRRRQIVNIDVEAEDMANEQLSIFPSNVQGVEATQAPVREGRSAHPQVFAMMPPFGYYQPQEIQSGFDNDPSLALPYYGSYVQPAAISQPRIFFGALNGLLFPKFVVTKTETVTMVSIVPSTSTLSPTCSTANPGALQCPP